MTTEEEARVDGAAVWKLVQVSITISVPVITVAVGWLLGRVMDNSSRLTAMEANRYTVSDAKSDRKEIDKELQTQRQNFTQEVQRIRELIYQIDKKVSSVSPSQEWLQSEVRTLQSVMGEIKRSLKQFEKDP